MTCVFCRIIRRELPASIVYEDDLCIGFLDIHPINDGHVLVVPKEHQSHLTAVDDKTTGHMFLVGKKVLKALEQSDVRCDGANLFLSDGAVAGQEVMHSHLHIVPRYRGDGQRTGFIHSEEVPRKCLDEIAGKIKKFL